MSRFRFIEAEQANYALALLYRVLGISRAGYGAWAKRSASLRTQADIALTERIRQVYRQSRGTYGAPRVHAALVAEGQSSGCKRIARLMRLAGLPGCVRRRKHPQTTVVNPAAVPTPNLVQRQFTPVAPTYLWIGDITYLRTDEGWLYRAVLLDALPEGSWAGRWRSTCGWSWCWMRSDGVWAAGAWNGSLVHHTDRGSQYTAGAYQQALTEQSITCSMRRTGNCYDNAAAESFFATLNQELIERPVWATRREVRTGVFAWIEVFYNRQRRQSTLGYLSPGEFRTAPTY